MSNIDLRKINGYHNIYCNGKYIVFAGKKLWIYETNGRLIACKREVSNIEKVAFLPGDLLLTGWGKGASYRLISLTDGTELWNIPAFPISHGVDSFAITPDCKTVYDCYGWQTDEYIVRIDVTAGQAEPVRLHPGLGNISDIICDRDGALCILEAHHEEIDGQTFSQNGIRLQHVNGYDNGSAYHWKNKWQLPGIPSTASRFLGEAEKVLSTGLIIFEPATGLSYSILENNSGWEPPYPLNHSCSVDEQKRYLTLHYSGKGVAIVNLDTRKIVAQYAGELPGCIIGDEYWISSENGIRRLPFPYMEDFLSSKTIFWA